jgi:hypothetical protein
MKKLHKVVMTHSQTASQYRVNLPTKMIEKLNIQKTGYLLIELVENHIRIYPVDITKREVLETTRGV